MKNDLITYHTSLEETNSVVETMQWKLENIKADGKDIENSIADYVAHTMNNLNNKEDYVKSAIKEAQTALKAIQEQKHDVGVGVASFMAEFGADKLKGVTWCSSISVTKGKEPTTKKKFVTNLTTKEKEQLIIDAGLGYYEDVEVPATQSSVRVNKRKVLIPEVVDED